MTKGMVRVLKCRKMGQLARASGSTISESSGSETPSSLARISRLTLRNQCDRLMRKIRSLRMSLIFLATNSRRTRRTQGVPAA